MTTRPPLACRNSSCSNPATEKGYCAKCAAALFTPKKPELPQSKFAANQQWKHLYNCKRWHDLRAAILRRDIICVVCWRRPSSVADHISDHRGNLILFYSFSNLRGVCKPCHDEKTGTTHGSGGRTPGKPGLVEGKIRDYVPKLITVTNPTGVPGFDFLGAINRHRSNPVDVPAKDEVKWDNHGEEDPDIA